MLVLGGVIEQVRLDVALPPPPAVAPALEPPKPPRADWDRAKTPPSVAPVKLPSRFRRPSRLPRRRHKFPAALAAAVTASEALAD